MKNVIIATSVIAMVCAAFLVGYFLNLQPNAVSDLPENLVITNVDLSIDHTEYRISVTVNNTGISNVEIVKLLFNNVKQSSASPSFPISLAPDEGVIISSTINVTASEYQTEALNIDVVTSKGNTFSKIFTASQTIGFMGSSSLTITNISFEAGNKATLSVKNTGTTTLTVTTIRVNNVLATISDPSTLTYVEGDKGTISIDIAWTPGNPYKFDIYDANWQVVGSYQATAPA